jgi:hypothetical protein
MWVLKPLSLFFPTFRGETLSDQMHAYTLLDRLLVNTRQNHSVILSKMCAIDHTMISLLRTHTCSEKYFNTCAVYLLLSIFYTMTNKFTIN